MSRIFNSRVNKLMLTQKNISNPATQEDTNKYRITILSCDTSWLKPAQTNQASRPPLAQFAVLESPPVLEPTLLYHINTLN